MTEAIITTDYRRLTIDCQPDRGGVFLLVRQGYMEGLRRGTRWR